jgi:hypothetical protein
MLDEFNLLGLDLIH